MSKQRVRKYNERPTCFKGPLNYQPILLSDSKGNYLREFSYLIEENGYFIDFQCKGGLRLLDQYFWLRNNLQRKVNTYGYIVLYIWLGTCDLTLRKTVQVINDQGRSVKRNYIDLRHSSEVQAVAYFRDQITKYVNLVSQFPTVKLVFLKIPYYSIQEYNKYLRNQDYQRFKENDFKLTERITLCNEYLDEVNESLGATSPNFRKDLLHFRRSSGETGRKSSLSFSLYKDGLHPNRDLAYCWMKKIVTQIFVDCR